ncbi:MAG: MlaC/ttg2D family ABC transporter substrate-binding protein [Candidatus Binatia bacterium]
MIVKTRQRFIRTVLLPLSAILLLVVSVTPVNAGAPAQEIQGAIEKVLTILKDPQLQAESKKQQRLDQLRRVVYPKFDFAEMAKRSLGAQWQRRSAEEQREFVKLFTELMENAYMSNLAGYDGEKVVVAGEKQDQEFAEVDTKVVTKTGEAIAVNYKLRQASGNWKIYDVVIENISLVNNYRSQFNRVIARSSFDELMRRMKDKQFDTAGKKST